MELSKVDNVNVNSVILHDLCEIHPQMSKEQFETLTESLLLDGQQQPISLYRGKVVDGRHRVWAMRNLGIDFAKAVELPRNTRMDDVKSFVRASETRRHQTKTQLACHAYLALINPKTHIKTAAQAALEFGVTTKDVSHCKYIANNLGINIIESFSLGKTENVYVGNAYFNYSSARALYDALHRKNKDFIVKKPTRNLVINLNEERANVRTFCQNDSVELIGAKLQLMQDYLKERAE